MRVRLSLDGVDFSNECDVVSLAITQDSTQAISTASVRVFQNSTGPGAPGRYDVAAYDVDAFGWVVDEWQEIQLWDEDTGQILFAGYVLGVARVPQANYLWFELNCSDYGILLDRRIISKAWPDGTPDSTVVADCIATTPELAAGHVETVAANVGGLEVKDTRARDALDQLCTLTGGEWNVGYDGKVNYYQSGSIPAPFSLNDDTPDNVASFDFGLRQYTRDFAQGANRVTVLGAVVDGAELRATANDYASQGKYGLLDVTIANRQIVDATTAALFATTQVLVRGTPKEVFEVDIYESGLTRGQTIDVYSLRLGIVAPYIIRTVTITVMAPDRARKPVPGHKLKYAATLGARPADAVFELMRMQRRPTDSTSLPFVGPTAAFTLPDGRTVEVRNGLIARVR